MATLQSKEAIDTEALRRDLENVIRGEVRFRKGDRALYATDSSNYRQLPLGVVAPMDTDDVIATVAACRTRGAPIVTRGGGTSLGGQGCNEGVVLDFSKYMYKVLEVDAEHRLARVQPGAACDYLNHAAAPHGLRFGPDPSTHKSCSFGGMIGNNACGTHSVMAAIEGNGPRVSDNLRSMRVLTYDGEIMEVGETEGAPLQNALSLKGPQGKIYRKLDQLRKDYADDIRNRFPKIPRRVSGYNLDDLLPEKGFNLAKALAGTEGTCVVYLEATVDLIKTRRATVLLVLSFQDIYQAADAVPEVISYRPDACEGVDDFLLADMRRKKLKVTELNLFPEGKGWLLVEFGADTAEEAIDKARQLQNKADQIGATEAVIYENELEQRSLWRGRESGLGATAHVPQRPDAWEGWEDSAVPPEKLGDYLRDLRRLYDKYEYRGPFYGHFGQGLVHSRITFDLRTTDGIRAFRSFISEATDLVAHYGGVPSGEHGDGQSKAEFLHKIYGDRLIQAFREFKTIWDPQGKMNPGKVVDPHRVDENLRLGSDYNPIQPETHFQYPEDNGSFAYATERCVGVGDCRKIEGGTMCPSYMATREEMHSTRGRTHLLFEMLNSNKLSNQKNPWRNEEVHEALSLCLACKACKSECPVNVDMATYKAEFYSHYYKGRLRDRSAYSMGLIYWWARLASRIPRTANFFASTPPFSHALKWIGGIAPQRDVPRFASQTFTSWHAKQANRRIGNANTTTKRVILWPDTFNNFLSTGAAKASATVLENAGFAVDLPQRRLCCGRPLYDFGMLDTAKRLLRQILDSLREDLRNGVKIVGVEPSCIAVFRDELVNLFPHDEDAKRLAKSAVLLSEFLNEDAADWQIPQLPRKALVHRHCHHHAIMTFDAEEAILQRLGLDYEILDSGCCGMAGSFGFEKENYPVSKACADRVLIPRIREADKDTLIIADGFSCREQIESFTDRKPLHLSEVILMALDQAPSSR